MRDIKKKILISFCGLQSIKLCPILMYTNMRCGQFGEGMIMIQKDIMTTKYT